MSWNPYCIPIRPAAILGLLTTSAVWGSSFSSIKICGELLVAGVKPGTTPAFGPILLTALRFSVALPLAGLLFLRSRPWEMRREHFIPLAKVGFAMALGFLTQAAGLAWATATISAFLTSLTVCAVPALEWAFFRKAPSVRLVVAVALATAAVFLMSLPATRGWGFGPGEVLTLLCALFFAFHVVWTGESARRVGVGRLTLGGFVITGVASWFLVVVLFPQCIRGALGAIVTSSEAGRFWLHFGWIVAGPTLGAMTLMNTCQRHVRPTEAAVIYTTEPLFAAVFALLLRGRSEMLGTAGLGGAALIIAADLLAALPRKATRSVEGNQPRSEMP